MNRTKNLLRLAVPVLLLIPTTIYAQADAAVGGRVGNGGGSAFSFLQTVKSVMNLLVPIMVGLALIYFIYGLAEYILISGESGKKEEGRTRMIWGTIAMFVLVSVWGLVAFLQKTVGIDANVQVVSPGLPTI
ncbi:MAG: hypothetical protein WC764_00805 [Candidatus Paceibacterota bacterium]